MSELAAVLARRERPGVFVADDGLGSPLDLRRAVEDAGWRLARIHGWAGESETKGAFLGAVGTALGFPDHYGLNLDAFADCLHDLAHPTVLLWEGWGGLARSDARTFAAVTSILGDRAERDLAAPLVVLLSGAGPEVDVPTVG